VLSSDNENFRQPLSCDSHRSVVCSPYSFQAEGGSRVLRDPTIADRSRLGGSSRRGVDRNGGPYAVELLAVTERLRRLAAVCVVDAVGEVHDSRVHYDHGHASGAAMARHRLDKIRKMIAACELLAESWRAGELSVDQAGVLARGFANPRVRDKFIDEQPRLLGWCDRPLKVLERKMADWVELTDQDGPEPRPEPAHRDRDASLVQDHFSKGWTLQSRFGSLQGDKLNRRSSKSSPTRCTTRTSR